MILLFAANKRDNVDRMPRAGVFRWNQIFLPRPGIFVWKMSLLFFSCGHPLIRLELPPSYISDNNHHNTQRDGPATDICEGRI